MITYSKRQIVILAVFSFCQFCTAACFSIQAPFYPAEAESKGAIPSEYGLVFGIYELVIFLVSPLYGKYLKSIGVKIVNNCGLFTVAVACTLFGLLHKINDKDTFIGLSFAIRIVEACGASAFLTAAFCILAKEFPNNVASAFATVETFFGIGLIAGPTIGGALFQTGGYILPFITVGGLLLVASLLVLCVLPSQDDVHESRKPKWLVISLLKVPKVLLNLFTVLSASLSIGFLQSTLEPHLRPIGLSPVQLGVVFIVNGAAYAFSAPFWGYLCDKVVSPRLICAIGCVLVSTSFILIGPAPFLPFSTNLPLCIFALVFHGLGFGAELVATFSGLNKDVMEDGFNHEECHDILAGFWNSAFALGCFIGPSIAGILFDAIGFRYATLLVFVLHSMLFVVTIAFFLFKKKSTPAIDPEEERPLLNSVPSTEEAPPSTQNRKILKKMPSFCCSSSVRDFSFLATE